MKKILKYMQKRDWLLFVASTILILGQVYLDLKLPDYMSEITRLTQTQGSAMSDIFAAGASMLLCALGSLSLAFIVGFFAARLSAGLSMRLRSLMFHKVESFSPQQINLFSTSSLINRTTNDITQVQMIVAMGMQVAVKAPILAVFAILKISRKSWQWTTATGVALILLFCIIAVILLIAVPRFKKIQIFSDNISRITRENLTGVRVVRAYNAETYQAEKFEVVNEAVTTNSLVAGRAMSILQPGITFISNTLNLAIYTIGAVMINASDMAGRLPLFSDMVVFLSYAMQIVMAVMMLTMIIIHFPKAQVSATRISQVLDTEITIKDGGKTEGLANIRGKVEFKNVFFRYPDAAESVLEDISFTANVGETIAFIGSSGSGKSTLVNLICRLYDVTQGEILIDGINIKEYTLEALHNKIGYVPQKAVLFHGTITSNVAFGDNGQLETQDNAIENAISVAQAEEFVSKLDGGIDAKIAQGGSNISGGQKQRIAIARAIARNPEFYIFDDSFSALDYKTDRVLRSALNKQTTNATTFIVAQRIGTIADADKIIVMEDGRMVGCDTHNNLLKNCEIYQEIAYSQVSKEELA